MLILSIGYSQVRIDDWKALTSPLNVRDLTNLDNELFAATEGGIFHIKDQVYETYTTVDGLLGVDLAAIDHDHNSNIWIGGNVPFGFLQVYDPKENKSIISFDFDLTGILDIQVLDSLAFVLFQDGQDFGIMKFLLNIVLCRSISPSKINSIYPNLMSRNCICSVFYHDSKCSF